MPLPDGGANVQWPPVGWDEVFAKMEEWAAWYSGDPVRISEVHAARAYMPTREGAMWSRQLRGERRVMLHVPLPGDIAGVSSDLLFSEPPGILVDAAHADEADPVAKRTQERLDEIVDESQLVAVLQEAADVASALGGVYLKATWDRALAPWPFLTIAQADNAVPEFRWGRLWGVTFWRVLPSDDNRVWRHLERHELDSAGNGVILNGLYVGTDGYLGRRVPLDRHPETAGIQEVMTPGVPGLLCEYIPNRRPNRLWRGSSLGVSDYAGVEGLFDALDEVYTSWLRDIRLGQRRIVVPSQWLDWREDDQQQPRPFFDVDREVFTRLDVDPAVTDKAGITPIDFAIRADEHARTARELMERIITATGYSPSSFGLLGEGGTLTATEVRAKERRSFVTTGKKQQYWRGPLARMAQVLLALDVAVFRTPGIDPNLSLTVEFADSVRPDLNELASSVDLLNRAQAASLKTRVWLLHPEWTEEMVDEEVRRIMEEQGMTVPDPMQIGLA